MTPRDRAPNVELKNEVKADGSVCPELPSLKGASIWSGKPASGEMGVMGVFGCP